jgi:DNA-binding IclR family transcriptional regulator
VLASGGSDKGRVQSVSRATELLNAVARAVGSEATARELAVTTGLNRATAYRILRTLEAHGLLNRDPYTREYSIGTAIVDLARAAPAETWSTRAHELLQTLSLQTRETLALAMGEDGDLRFVDEVRPPDTVGESWLGASAAPLHATSAGKVFLAYAERPLTAYVEDPPTRYTENTLGTLASLRDELDQVRSRGYALCRGEYDADSWGVSAPLLNGDQKLLGVLSCWGPASRGEVERFAALGSLIRDAARRMTAR